MENTVKFEAIPLNGTVMTTRQFLNACKKRIFLDLWGYGYYASPLMMSNIRISPSEVLLNGKWDRKYSHVVWFYR
jgi:hypothetical protein